VHILFEAKFLEESNFLPFMWGRWCLISCLIISYHLTWAHMTISIFLSFSLSLSLIFTLLLTIPIFHLRKLTVVCSQKFKVCFWVSSSKFQALQQDKSNIYFEAVQYYFDTVISTYQILEPGFIILT